MTPAPKAPPTPGRMLDPAPKFWIGDEVFGIAEYRQEVKTPCADCNGSGKIALKSGPAECPTCYGRRYSVHWETMSWHLDSRGPGVVRDVRFKVYRGEREEGYMCDGTGVGSGQVWPDDRLFPTREEALAECERRNAPLGPTDLADLNPEPGNGPSYTEVRNPNGSHK